MLNVSRFLELFFPVGLNSSGNRNLPIGFYDIERKILLTLPGISP